MSFFAQVKNSAYNLFGFKDITMKHIKIEEKGTSYYVKFSLVKCLLDIWSNILLNGSAYSWFPTIPPLISKCLIPYKVFPYVEHILSFNGSPL